MKNLETSSSTLTAPSNGEQAPNKFTPGPWMILPEQNTGRVGQFCILTENGPRLDIASTYGWPNTPIEANARLISAAPDMLAALEAMLALYGKPHREEYVDGGASYQLALNTVVNARAAIAKATGAA